MSQILYASKSAAAENDTFNMNEHLLMKFFSLFAPLCLKLFSFFAYVLSVQFSTESNLESNFWQGTEYNEIPPQGNI